VLVTVNFQDANFLPPDPDDDDKSMDSASQGPIRVGTTKEMMGRNGAGEGSIVTLVDVLYAHVSHDAGSRIRHLAFKDWGSKVTVSLTTAP
jgi:hypothetical protein